MNNEADTDDRFLDEDRDEDQDEEEEEPVSEEWRVHPAVIPWLEKKLKVKRLGPSVERFLREELAYEHDLMCHPDTLGEAEQTKLIAQVWAVRLYEKKQRKAAVPLQEIDLVAEAEQQPSQQRRRSALSQQQQLPPTRGTTKPPGESLPLKPVEQDAAEAIRAHLSVLLAGLPRVRQFRRDVLGGEDALLTPEQADAFIRSPAVRVLGRTDWKAAGITWQPKQQPQQEEKKAEHGGGGFTSRVVSDESLVLDNHHAARRRKRADASLVWQPSLAPDAANYRCRRIGVQVQTVSGEAPLLRKMEWMRTLNEEPLWIPFLPADLKDTTAESEAEGSDDLFPQMFPYSVAHELGMLGEWLAKALSAWEPWQMSLFVLTGELEPMQPVQVRKQPSPLVEKTALNAPSKIWEIQQQRLVWGTGSMRGMIRIAAEPWVSAETIARCWMEAQRQTLGTKRLHRFPSSAILKMLPLVARTLGNSQSDRQRQRAGKRKPSLRGVLLQQQVKQREAEEESPYPGDYSSFMKAYKNACRMLELPWDLGGRIARK